MSSELKSCPFCKSKRGDLHFLKIYAYAKEREYYVSCDSCGTTGGVGRSWDEAIDIWNKGVSEVEAKEAEKELRVGLRPCPFCGGGAGLHRNFDQWFVRCDKCEASTTNLQDKEEVVANWNRRVSEIGRYKQ